MLLVAYSVVLRLLGVGWADGIDFVSGGGEVGKQVKHGPVDELSCSDPRLRVIDVVE